MQEIKRTFVAVSVTIPNENLQIINNLKGLVAHEKMRWIQPLNLHLTLAFFGNTKLRQLNELIRIFKSIGSKVQPFEMEVSAMDVFPSKKTPRVLFMNVHKNDNLQNLHWLIKNAAMTTGITIGDKTYKPHITLARMKSIEDQEAFNHHVSRLGSSVNFKKMVDRFFFFESVLTSKGPVYNVLSEHPLNTFGA